MERFGKLYIKESKLLIVMYYLKSSGIITMLTVCIAVLVSAYQPKPKKNGDIKAATERGKKVYEMYCSACHQPEGEGVPRLNPPLAKTKWVTGDKVKLIKVVLNGLKGGEVEIDGNKFNNPMASHSFLSDDEIADVLTYIRNVFGNKASAVTAAEVKVVRGK
jgi:mono/diheme cytochrome c family protein